MISVNLKSASLAPLVVALLAALNGCSNTVALQNPTIPDPLIPKLPLSVVVQYPEQFEHYVHEEKVVGKDEWSIDLGRSNSLLFTKLFGDMFMHCTIVGPPVDPEKMSTDCRFVPPGTDLKSLQFDALLEPSIDAFEFSVPEQSQTDSFAVWIRYRLKMFDHDGNEIVNWPLSAYGKAQNTFMGSDEALQRAAVLAMRDAAALVILQMDKSADISAFAARLGKSVAARPEPTGGGLRDSLADGVVEGPVKPFPAGSVLHTTTTEEPPDDSG